MTQRRGRRAAALAVVLAALAGCASQGGRAPVEDLSLGATPPVPAPTAARAVVVSAPRPRKPALPARRVPAADIPASHKVRAGETLYGISFQYGLDYRDVAAWNHISSPYKVLRGQRLRLHPAQMAAARPAAPPDPAVDGGTRLPPPARRPPVARPAAPVPDRDEERPAARTAAAGVVWRWPTGGRLRAGFTATGGKGVDIGGVPGQAVVAAAPGKVVYAGNGLRGFGQLIIIKHSPDYLSAYAFNRKLLVREGQKVAAGQRIAEMGQADDGAAKLHFEIRRLGKPVDPLHYLPSDHTP